MKHKAINTFVKTKTNFNNLSKEIYAFEKEAGFDKSSSNKLIDSIKNETENYKRAKSKIIRQNKLIDIICLAIQVSRREGMNLDNAWKGWWQKNKKYLKQT